MADLNDRFEAPVFKHERERIVQRGHVRQCGFTALFIRNGITPVRGKSKSPSFVFKRRVPYISPLNERVLRPKG